MLTLKMLQNRNTFKITDPKVESEQVEKITCNVIKNIEKQGVNLSDAHKKEIRDITTLLESPMVGDIQSPVVIPSEMGRGKSTIIKCFLETKTEVEDFGAIVVKETIEDIVKLEKELAGKAKGLFTFHQAYCLEGKERYKESVCKKCNVRYKCPIKLAPIEQRKYPILIITHERLRLEMQQKGQLSDFVRFNKGKRTMLLIDEKPSITVNKVLAKSDLKRLNTILDMSILGKCKERDQIQKYIELLHEETDPPKIKGNKEKIKRINPINKDFKISSELYDYIKRNYWNQLQGFEVLESIIALGGVIRIESFHSKLEGQIYTIDSIDYKKINLRTFIFDGTALYDLDYYYFKYPILELERGRKYPNLNINNCPSINLSKSFIQSKRKPLKIELIKKDIPCPEQLLIVTYLDLEEKIRGIFEERTWVDHFNNLKGKNKYSNASVAIFLGVNNKGNAYYLAKAISLGYKGDDLNTVNKKGGCYIQDNFVRRVMYSDIFCDFLQNIFRTSLRKNCESAIKVYTFFADKDLVSLIEEYFNGCRLSLWYPKKFFEEYLRNNVSSKDKALLELHEFLNHYFKEQDKVTKKDLRKYLGYKEEKDNTFTNHLKDPFIQYSLEKNKIRVTKNKLTKISC